MHFDRQNPSEMADRIDLDLRHIRNPIHAEGLRTAFIKAEFLPYVRVDLISVKKWFVSQVLPCGLLFKQKVQVLEFPLFNTKEAQDEG